MLELRAYRNIFNDVFATTYNSIFSTPSGSIPLLKLYGLTGNTSDLFTQQITGQGTATATHTATIYAPDADGVYCSFGANKLLVKGGRALTTIADGAELGGELVTAADDREFTAVTGFWTTQAGVSITGGKVFFNNIDYSGFYRSLGVAGKRYQITVVVDSISSTLFVGSLSGGGGSNITTLGTHVIEFTATSSTLGVKATATLVTAYVDSISIKEVLPAYSITDVGGSPLSPEPTLYYVPAATNSQIYSNDQTNATYTATNITVAKDAVGVRGQTAEACTLTATAANGTVIAAAVTAASNTHALMVRMKRSVGTGVIELTVDGGTTWQDITSSLTTAFTNIPVAQAAVTNPSIGIRIVTSGDAVIIGNAELYLNNAIYNIRNLPPIFTTAAPVSTDETVYKYDIANHSDTQGLVYFEWVTSISAAEKPAGYLSLLGTSYTSPQIAYARTAYAASNDSIGIGDGTGSVNQSTPRSAGDIIKIAAVYDATLNLMTVCINGITASAVAYDGAFDTSYNAIKPFTRYFTWAEEMKNFQIWRGGTYAQLIAKAETLTGA